MELILGGAYAGKLTWAVQTRHFTQENLHDLALGLPGEKKPCLYHLEDLTWEAAKAGGTAQSVLDALVPLLDEQSVVIAREVGSGVVPMDKTERLWRELHGSVVKTLAARADRVTRIFFGLPEVLK